MSWRARTILLLLPFLLGYRFASGQTSPAPDPPSPGQAAQSPQPPASPSGQQDKSQTVTPPAAAGDNQNPPAGDSPNGQQTKRMIYVVPNFAAVSAYKQLPPLSTKGKFWLATQDSFDYSSFVWTGILAYQSYATDQYPELGTGGSGYARYYWRNFADGVSSTYFTEAIVPALTHEDPRYYTMEGGGAWRRFGYALSRVWWTKTDSGGGSFNFSEVGGNALEAGLSTLYYPPEERTFTKTMENWGAELESAALNNIAKEFWPDFRRHVLHRK